MTHAADTAFGMDVHPSPVVMTLVAFSTIGVAWLLTGSLRKTHLGSYKVALGLLVLGCVGAALACLGLKAPKTLIDWLVAFGFASAAFDGFLFYQTRYRACAENARKTEEARLAEIDRMLQKMREE